MDHIYKEDRERLVSRDTGWLEFKSYMEQINSDLNMEKVLSKQFIKKDPVYSYGIIEFVIKENYVSYHMFRRRNTVEYGDIIRGFVQKNNLFEMLCLISEDERHRLLNNTWQEIWNDYWIDHSDSSKDRLIEQSKTSVILAKELLIKLNGKISRKIKQRPLEFPKGKADGIEDGFETALREAREETKDSFTQGRLYFQSPVTQNFTGSNGRKYSTCYYIWQRNEIYYCNTQTLGDSPETKCSCSTDVYKSPGRKCHCLDNIRLRSKTISHELESDTWINIPIFENRKQLWEWQNSIDPFKEFGIFKRHFDTIMIIHTHIT